MTALLHVEDLTVRFGGLTAVDGVSFAVEDGEIVGLIGPNGAGKTTCFGLITGFIAATAGHARFRGRSLTGLPPYRIARHGLARTFQKTSLFPRLTVHENVMIGQQARLTPGVWSALLRTAAQRRELTVVRRQADEVLDFLAMSVVRDVELPIHMEVVGQVSPTVGIPYVSARTSRKGNRRGHCQPQIALLGHKNFAISNRQHPAAIAPATTSKVWRQ